MHETAVLNFRNAVEMHDTVVLNFRHAVEMNDTAVLNFRHAVEMTTTTTIMLYEEKMAVQRISHTRINSMAFRVSSVHIDCYYTLHYNKLD